MRFHKYQPITEVRRLNDPTYVYSEDRDKKTDEIKSVTVELAGRVSERLTKKIKEYAKICDMFKQIQEERDKLNEELGVECSDLFDTDDALYTRYVKTVYIMQLTLSAQMPKTSPDVTAIDYESLSEKLIEMILELAPEMKSKVDELLTAYTTVTKGVTKTAPLKLGWAKNKDKEEVKKTKAKLSGQMNENIFTDIGKFITGVVAKLRNSFNRFFSKFDTHIAKAMQMASELGIVYESAMIKERNQTIPTFDKFLNESSVGNFVIYAESKRGNKFYLADAKSMSEAKKIQKEFLLKVSNSLNFDAVGIESTRYWDEYEHNNQTMFYAKDASTGVKLAIVFDDRKNCYFVNDGHRTKSLSFDEGRAKIENGLWIPVHERTLSADAFNDPHFYEAVIKESLNENSLETTLREFVNKYYK